MKFADGMPQFRDGLAVKTKPDIWPRFTGWVVAVFKLRACGCIKIAVENNDGVCLLFRPSELQEENGRQFIPALPVRDTQA